MTRVSPLRLLVSGLLAWAAIGVLTAALDRPPRFVARWGGHTKDVGFAAAADAASAFVAGATWSADFPVSVGASPNGSVWCGFLTQLHAATGAFAQSSVLCARGMTYARAAATDGLGGVWVGGSSNGSGLPVTKNAAQKHFGGGSGVGDAFIGRWNRQGQIDYLTYWGGEGDDTVWGLVSDGGGVWAAGTTTSPPRLKHTGGSAQSGTVVPPDGFIAHIGVGGRLDAVKTLGGDGIDEIYDLARIDAGHAVVVGATSSNGNAVGRPRGSLDGFVALIDMTTLSTSWIVRLGSPEDDALRAVVVVNGRTIVAVGRTDGAACHPRAGGADGWLVAMSLTGSVLRNECVGTAAADQLSDVTATPAGDIWITGTSASASAPGSLRRATSGEAYDRAFVARSSARGGIDSMQFLSDEISRGYGIVADQDGNVYAVGETTAIPSRTHAWRPALSPTRGAFRATQRLGSTDPYVIALGRTSPDRTRGSRP